MNVKWGAENEINPDRTQYECLRGADNEINPDSSLYECENDTKLLKILSLLTIAMQLNK
jgi:hypothetical protein